MIRFHNQIKGPNKGLSFQNESDAPEPLGQRLIWTQNFILIFTHGMCWSCIRHFALSFQGIACWGQRHRMLSFEPDQRLKSMSHRLWLGTGVFDLSRKNVLKVFFCLHLNRSKRFKKPLKKNVFFYFFPKAGLIISNDYKVSLLVPKRDPRRQYFPTVSRRYI